MSPRPALHFASRLCIADSLSLVASIFGRATSGFDVIHEIENARRDKGDKPFDEIKIISIEISAGI